MSENYGEQSEPQRPRYGEQPEPQRPYQMPPAPPSWPPSAGPQQPPPGPPGQPPKRSHKARNITLGVVGGLAVIIIASAIANGGKGSSGNPGSSISSIGASTPTTAASSSAPALPADQTKFVSDLRSYMTGQGVSNTSSDAAIAGLGKSICQVASSGGSSSDIAAVLGGKAQADFSIKPGKLVRMAEKDMCPKYLPKPVQVLMRFSGNGIRNSPPFRVGSQVTVRYSFDCSAYGGSGNFIADLQYGNQTSLNSDDQQIANALAGHEAQTTTVYPQDPGKDYYLAVNSECNWSIVVKGTP